VPIEPSKKYCFLKLELIEGEFRRRRARYGKCSGATKPQTS